MRRLLVAGNWKMHGSVSMTAELISGVAQRAGHDRMYDILVCPPTAYLAQASELAKPLNIAVGAQNVSQHPKGAYTGESSLSMLNDVGCQYVLLGHSERREYFGDTDELVAEKFAACIETDIVPVLCVGELLEQREAGETEHVVKAQIEAVISRVGIGGFANAVIAYEPVWAIGTGKTASPLQAQEVHEFIRNLLAQHDQQIAEKTQILYGGSVKPSNAEELFAQKDIDGGLIGGASLEVDSFAGICEAAEKLSGS